MHFAVAGTGSLTIFNIVWIQPAGKYCSVCLLRLKETTVEIQTGVKFAKYVSPLVSSIS